MGQDTTSRSTDTADRKQRYFRSPERLFCFNSQWYFATREGNCGPFRSKDVARLEVDRYIEERLALSGFQRSRRAAANSLPADLGLALVPLD